MSVCAIIVASGEGSRMGQDKIWMDLCGQPVLFWSLDVFEKSDWIDDIVVVLHGGRFEQFKPYWKRWSKIGNVCSGGPRRQDSVANGLKMVPGQTHYVAIHDGARPLVQEETIAKGVTTVKQFGSAVPVVPVTDTILRVKPNKILCQLLSQPQRRNEMVATQTPQFFRYDWLTKGYTLAQEEPDVTLTDEASLLLWWHPIKTFESFQTNFKLTTPEDVVMATHILQRRKECEE